MKSNYKRLGDYIQEIDIRNQNDMPLELWGVSIEKKFIKSVANIIGTDLAKYKIVKRNQFVCSLMQVSRDEKIPIALWSKNDKTIVSPAYKVFEIIQQNALIPEYLNLWFQRAEFDREASYYGVGGVRGSLEWNDFCDMQLPIPDITEQQKIVDAYNVIENRIALKRKINENLEAQAFAIYKNLCDLDKTSHNGTVGDLAENIICGKTPPTIDKDNFIGDIPFITIPDMHDNVYVLYTERYLSKKGLTCTIPKDSICVSCIASAGLVCLTDKMSQTNQQINSIICKKEISPYFVFFQMKESSDYIKQIGSCGSTTCNLSKTAFSEIGVTIPSNQTQEIITKYLIAFFNTIKQNQKHIYKLKEVCENLLGQLA